MTDHHHRSDPKQINTKLNNYPSFQPLTPYTFHLINYTTTNSTMEYLTEQVMQTQLFTIATETDGLTLNPALIQIECVGHPSTIILVECCHLPKPHSHLFNQISRLFLSIFEPAKEIQGWGDLSIALKPFIGYDLFSMSNIQHTHFSDVQQLFREWYNGIFPHSEGCCPSEVSILGEDFIYLHPTNSDRNLSFIAKQYDYLSCSCPHRPCKNPNDNWSLHAAVQATFQEFLDDAHSLAPWGRALGFVSDIFIPKRLVGEQRSMEIAKEKEYRRQLMEYAARICLSITKLSVAIRYRWSKHDLERHIQSTHFQANPSAISNTESSTASRDPIIPNTNDTITNHKPISDGHTIDGVNATTTVSIVPSSSDAQPEIHNGQILSKKKKKRRSVQARIKRHEKKRAVQRAHKSACCLNRTVYHDFKKEQIEQILDQLQIRRRRCHIGQNYLLSIYCYSPTDKIRYDDLLGDQYFTRFHYDQVFNSTSFLSQMDHLLPDACE
jgi:hypothetical protein